MTRKEFEILKGRSLKIADRVQLRHSVNGCDDVSIADFACLYELCHDLLVKIKELGKIPDIDP